MGKDFVKLDTWRQSYTDKQGVEYVKIAGKKIPVPDLTSNDKLFNTKFLDKSHDTRVSIMEHDV